MSNQPRLRLDLLPQGIQVRVARVAAGMSQYDLASRVGLDRRRLSEYEQGRGGGLNIEQIDRLRAVLNEELTRLYPEDTA